MQGDVILFEKLVEGGSIKALKRPKDATGAWTYLLVCDERDAIFDDDRSPDELYQEQTFSSEAALIEAYMKRTRG
jgi:hypothetical protein